MIKKYWTRGFRNLEETLLVFDDASDVFFWGENNQGKTNTLEGLYLLGNGVSPVTDDLKHVVQSNQANALLGIEFLAGETSHKLYLKVNADGKKTIQLNENILKSMTPIRKMVNIAFLSADIIRIFQENAEFRRRELDLFCTLIFSDFSTIKRQYDRILKQKNMALKSSLQETERKIWNTQLVQLGGKIVQYRKKALYLLEGQLKTLIKQIKPELSDSLQLSYLYYRLNEHYSTEEEYLQDFALKLDQDVFKEQQVGHTLVGPHRDDFKIEIHRKSLFTHFSRGINRMVAILLKLAELIELDSRYKNFPILLLDDTFAELDETNKQHLIVLLSTYSKLLYTSVTKQDAELFKSVRVIRVEKGKFYG